MSFAENFTQSAQRESVFFFFFFFLLFEQNIHTQT